MPSLGSINVKRGVFFTKIGLRHVNTSFQNFNALLKNVSGGVRNVKIGVKDVNTSLENVNGRLINLNSSLKKPKTEVSGLMIGILYLSAEVFNVKN